MQSWVDFHVEALMRLVASNAASLIIYFVPVASHK